MKPQYQISFSGGRTSAYMTKLLLDNWSDRYDFHRRMEAQYRSHGPQVGDRVFFRKNLDTDALFKLYEENKATPMRQARADEDGGCSESCELFETIANDQTLARL